MNKLLILLGFILILISITVYINYKKKPSIKNDGPINDKFTSIVTTNSINSKLKNKKVRFCPTQKQDIFIFEDSVINQSQTPDHISELNNISDVVTLFNIYVNFDTIDGKKKIVEQECKYIDDTNIRLDHIKKIKNDLYDLKNYIKNDSRLYKFMFSIDELINKLDNVNESNFNAIYSMSYLFIILLEILIIQNKSSSIEVMPDNIKNNNIYHNALDYVI